MTLQRLEPGLDGVEEWMGVLYRTILQTDAISIVDSLSPAGSGPPRHVHANEDEAFVILTGACDVWIEGETTRCEAGSSILIARGKEHTFRVTDEGESRHLVILTPGGFEGFFSDMARERFMAPEQMGDIAAVGARYGLTFTGPPLGMES